MTDQQEQATAEAPATTEKVEAHKENSDKKPNTMMAIVAYVIFFVPLLTEDKNDPFVKFHVKQSIVLVLSWVIVSIVTSIIPFLGWFILGPLASIFFIVLWIMGIINAANGQKKELPLIGKYAEQMLKF